MGLGHIGSKLAWVNLRDVRIRSDLFGIDFLILQGLKSAKYSPKI